MEYPAPEESTLGSVSSEPSIHAAAPHPSWTNWKVLIPRFGRELLPHLVLLGGPDGLDSSLKSLGIAERVSRSISTKDPADAVVVLGGSAPSVQKVAASLRPGGWLYWETQRPGTMFPALAARRLAGELGEAGLTPTGLYWVRPRSSAPAAFVPLDVRGALAWYLETFSSPRLGALASRWPGSSRALAACAAGRVAVTAVAHESVPFPPALLAGLPAPLRATTLRPVVYFRERSRRAVVFPFSERGAVPEAVVKFSPVPERGFHTRQEQQTLSEIRARSNAAIQASVPEPLGLFEWSGLTVGVESFLPGRSIARSLSRPAPLSARTADLDRVVAWLCEFQIANAFGSPTWGSDRWSLGQWIEDPLRRLESGYSGLPSVERLFAGIRRAAARLVGAPLAMVLSNWSFSVGNVCQHNGRIAVYDWETVAQGLPLTDLIYFLVDWGRLVKERSGADWRTSFRDLLIAPPVDRVSAAVQNSIDRYLAALGIDRRFRPLLSVLTWVQRAEKRVRKDDPVRRPMDPRLVALAEAAGDWLDG
jgi:aminoglycoside phosphotransferase (APT) family kinase protein